MVADPHATAENPVALIIQRRILDEGFAAFTSWTGKVAEELKSVPGFIGQEVVPPCPPMQTEWLQILRFATPAAASSWLKSEAHARLGEEIRRHCSGPEDMHVLPEVNGRQAEAVSAIISFSVPEALEEAFLAWQARVQAAEAEFPGFLRHKVERPIADLHPDWVIIVSFDSDAHLNAWIESAERQALLQDGQPFNRALSVKRASYGFNFWFPAGPAGGQTPATIFKSNLIVLMVLYPVVFLWGYFISRPFIDSHGVPFWLSLFIGNVASTQLLGWWIAPAAFRRLAWWLTPDPGLRRNLLGYGLLALIYALSMALYAALLAWNWGQPA